jgi:signal transduction histidine kinase
MRRHSKPTKSKVRSKPPGARPAPKNDTALVRTLRKRLAEAHEQQTATSEILRGIAGSPTDLQPVLDALVKSAGRLCEAADTYILLVEGDRLSVVALHGAAAETDRLSNTIHRGWLAGRAVVEARAVHVEDLARAEAEFPVGAAIAARLGHRTALAIPLLHNGVPIGALFVRRREVRPFSDGEIALLQTFADQAVIAIGNVRLFTELQASNRELTTALDRQTATSDILRVISSSPTDLTPVMTALVESAARLCEAQNAQLFRVEPGDQMRLVARCGPVRSTLEVNQARAITRGSVSGRTIVDRVALHIADLLADVATEYPDIAPAIVRQNIRTTVGVPLLREGVPIGAITAFRTEIRPFSEAQIELLKTFADQAVIAIENVRLFTELEQKTRELQAASQHKSEFLANMSHELRTPLNAVIGFSEVLSERMFGELNEKQEEYLKDIHASGTHLLSLINDILDLSKIEAGRMELELTDFHLPTALDSALTLVRERAGRRGIALQMNVDSRVDQIQADERKIRQVVLNLLSNAIKFTPEGGRIEILAALKDGFVEVSVSDTGVGIAPEDQDAVFEEFRQVGTAAKKVEGTGLGLTLCRKFVELHAGRIWVKSELGAGSTFTFSLPLRRA